MCHFMMPGPSVGGSDSRFADDALRLFAQNMRLCGASPREFDAKVIGGGNMFHGIFDDKHDIGTLNVEAAFRQLERLGVRIVARHCGGDGYRSVTFDLWNGELRLCHSPCGLE
jgi:chemotaxis protein CheD